MKRYKKVEQDFIFTQLTMAKQECFRHDYIMIQAMTNSGTPMCPKSNWFAVQLHCYACQNIIQQFESQLSVDTAGIILPSIYVMLSLQCQPSVPWVVVDCSVVWGRPYICTGAVHCCTDVWGTEHTHRHAVWANQGCLVELHQNMIFDRIFSCSILAKHKT